MLIIFQESDFLKHWEKRPGSQNNILKTFQVFLVRQLLQPQVDMIMKKVYTPYIVTLICSN